MNELINSIAPVDTSFFDFLKVDSISLCKNLMKEDDEYWKRRGEEMSLNLFHQMANRVPAYMNFLKKYGIEKEKIKSYKDLQTVPIIEKSNYIDQYSLDDLCWDGKIETSYMLSSSSGSTGQPYFWPRSPQQTMQGAIICEPLYRELFRMDRLSTLYIIAFGMGTWIAGTYMMMATQWIAQKGYPITVATPGLNKKEVLKLVQIGDKYYDQTIIVGLPPFVKDIIDTGMEEGISWKDLRIKFAFTGEAFTERWRQNLVTKVSIQSLTDAVNLYGSADVGLIAHETPTTILIRSLAAKNMSISREIFQSERLPALYQFDPALRHLESLNGRLLITVNSMIPLTRYDTKDIGDIIYFTEISNKLRDFGTDLKLTLDSKGVNRLLWKLPFVYLFGRGKFSSSIYGITIYPEYIKFILDNPQLGNFLTGKFTISTEENRDFSQQLRLRVELREAQFPSSEIKDTIRRIFVLELPKISSEYSHLLEQIKEKAHPNISLHSYGDPDFFPTSSIKKTT